MSDISNGALVEGNYIHGYVGTPTPAAYLGKGIEIWYQVHNALVEDNTIANMLTAGIGISNGSDNNVIRDNIITGITGNGGSRRRRRPLDQLQRHGKKRLISC